MHATGNTHAEPRVRLTDICVKSLRLYELPRAMRNVSCSWSCLHRLPQVPCLCLTALATRKSFVESNLCLSCCNCILFPFALEGEAQGAVEVSQGPMGSSGLTGKAGAAWHRPGQASTSPGDRLAHTGISPSHLNASPVLAPPWGHLGSLLPLINVSQAHPSNIRAINPA